MKREPLSPVKAHVKQIVDIGYRVVGVPYPGGRVVSPVKFGVGNSLDGECVH